MGKTSEGQQPEAKGTCNIVMSVNSAHRIATSTDTMGFVVPWVPIKASDIKWRQYQVSKEDAMMLEIWSLILVLHVHLDVSTISLLCLTLFNPGTSVPR